jgi:subfamily B ATP-binding cassette protein MsbA
MGTIGQRFGFALRRNLFAHLQRLSLRFHDRQRTGDLTTRLTSDIQNVQDVVANGAIVLINNGVLLAGMMGLMLWLNACFALAALSVSPLLFATIFRYTHRIKVAARAARTSDGLLASVAQETLAAMRVVQGLAQEDQQNDRFAAQNANSMQAYLEGIRYQARVAPLVDFLAAAGLAVVMWYGATRAMSGGLTTGDVVVFFAYVTNLYSPMKQLAKLSYAYNRASIGAERIGEVMRVRCEVIDSPKSPAAPLFSGRIEFRNVHFEYDPGQPILRGINLQLEAGERVALVGHSGAGKSTLASLVPRLYDPTSGAVLIDGIDIRSVRLNSLREQISLVLQDSLLFRGTIRENIAFGRPEASDLEIKQAAVAANADQFISQLPEGYATIVAERGTTLSGGQKQRIAIARAIIRNAAILILDEPTSGLDVASERAVIEALERAAENRTTLMIAHRLSTVRFADRISVMEEGRIVEEGPPTDLLRRNSRYAQLFKSQFAAA